MVAKPAGQIRCKSLVRTNANDWSGRMQAGGQVECNFATAKMSNPTGAQYPFFDNAEGKYRLGLLTGNFDAERPLKATIPLQSVIASNLV